MTKYFHYGFIGANCSEFEFELDVPVSESIRLDLSKIDVLLQKYNYSDTEPHFRNAPYLIKFRNQVIKTTFTICGHNINAMKELVKLFIDELHLPINYLSEINQFEIKSINRKITKNDV